MYWFVNTLSGVALWVTLQLLIVVRTNLLIKVVLYLPPWREWGSRGQRSPWGTRRSRCFLCPRSNGGRGKGSGHTGPPSRGSASPCSLGRTRTCSSPRGPCTCRHVGTATTRTRCTRTHTSDRCILRSAVHHLNSVTQGTIKISDEVFPRKHCLEFNKIIIKANSVFYQKIRINNLDGHGEQANLLKRLNESRKRRRFTTRSYDPSRLKNAPILDSISVRIILPIY